MTIGELRDLIIIISGIISIIVLIFLGLLAYAVYRRVSPIIRSVRTATSTVEEMVELAKEVASPCIRLASVVMGVKDGVNAAGRFFKKGKEAK